MFKRSFIGFAAVAFAVMAFGASAYGQIFVTSGKIELLKDDNTRVPVADAVIDIYRTDAKGGFPQAKSSKRGDWSIAGFQPGAIYALAISAPGCAPLVAPGIKAGQEKVNITLRPGDGRRLTEEEARAQVKGSTSIGGSTTTTASSGEGELSAEDKKKKAEYDAEVERINKKNEANKSKFDTVVRLLNEGQEAQKAGNLDLAIAKFDEGYKTDPEFAGTAPILLVRLAEVRKARAVATNNTAAATADVTEKVAKLSSAKADLGGAIVAFKSSIDVLAKANPGDVTAENATKLKSGALAGIKEVIRIAGVIKQVDDKVVTVAKETLTDILAVDADAKAKTDTRLYYATLFLGSTDTAVGVAAFRDVLTESPDSVDGLAGLGLSLTNAGFINFQTGTDTNNKALADQGKAELQEAANVLQRFVAIAPDGHKFKTEVSEALAGIKAVGNIVPQKGASGPKKKP